MLNTIEMREAIVNTVASFCKKNNLDYRTAWRLVYEKYGETYHIWPSIWYKGKPHHSKLDFLEFGGDNIIKINLVQYMTVVIGQTTKLKSFLLL